MFLIVSAFVLFYLIFMVCWLVAFIFTFVRLGRLFVFFIADLICHSKFRYFWFSR